METNTYAAFGAAQRQCPVHPRSTASIQGTDPKLLFGFEPGHPCATVLGWDEAASVLKDRTRFGQGAYGPNLERVLGHTVLSMDEPEHRRYRELILQALHRREMNRWEQEYVEPTVEEAIDAFAWRGRAELVGELALAVAPRVIARAMGLPADDVGQFIGWGRAMLNYVHDPETGSAAADQIARYCLRLARERRGGDGTDLITLLANVELHGERLGDEEIASFLRLLIPAGSDTTFRATSNLFAGLLTHPDQLELVRRDRSLVPQAIEEGLRWEPPMQIIPRQANEAVTLADLEIEAGSLVEVGIGPANRDDRRWERPHEFDVLRPSRPHMAFGQGNHTCVGLHLARLEIRCTLERALDRLPGLRLDPHAPPAQIAIRGLGFRAPTGLPVLFDPT